MNAQVITMTMITQLPCSLAAWENVYFRNGPKASSTTGIGRSATVRYLIEGRPSNPEVCFVLIEWRADEGLSGAS